MTTTFRISCSVPALNRKKYTPLSADRIGGSAVVTFCASVHCVGVFANLPPQVSV